jgi:hypothetical protein
MFGAPHRDPSRASARETPARADAVLARKENRENCNPLWQSLALRPMCLQTKLAVSQPDDPHEREADRVAEQVMRMVDPMVQPSHVAPTIHRKCAPCETSAPCPACTEEEEAISSEKRLMQRQIDRKAPAEGDSTKAAPTAESHGNGLGSGMPLPLSVRGFFERRFGYDVFVDLSGTAPIP